MRRFLFLLPILRVTATETNSDLYDCRLNCVHGGQCSFVSDDVKSLKLAYQSGRMIETCVCPSGYSGLGCELLEATCSEDTMKCPNGMPCTQTGDGHYTCECSDHMAVSEFAAKMCKKTYTEYCGVRFDPSQPISFCTNGGKCKSSILGAQRSPVNVTAIEAFQHEGCYCPPEFYGPHCEFLNIEDLAPSVSSTGLIGTEKSALDGSKATESADHAPSLPVILVCFFVCFIILAFVVFRRYSRRKRQRNELVSAPTSDSSGLSAVPTLSHRGLLDDVSVVTDDVYLEHSEYSYREGYSTESEFDAVEDDFSLLDPLTQPLETQSQAYYLW